ncbi:MAG: hypothetical protein NT004_02410 [Bacteroidetes bacterium]|nr:hypothetical protein [Bacteroidota bacterium]
MSDFEMWIYRGVIVISLSVVWYFAKQVLTELKQMNENIKSIGDKGLIHDGRLALVEKDLITHYQRLNEHAKKIREVERQHDSCINCKEA